MLNLPEEVPSAFESGEFAVHQIPGSFSGIWSDLERENCQQGLKGKQWIVGLTRKKPALVRWILTRHALSGYVKTMKEVA